MLPFLTMIFTAGLVAAPGTILFDRAYKLEETDPPGSLELYQSALSSGLAPDLARAAYWRMFFIYKDQENFGRALHISSLLPPSARAQIVEAIQERYSLSRPQLDTYVRALVNLAATNADKKSSGAAELESLYKKAAPAFQKRIVQDLAENGMESRALALLSDSENDPDSILRRCDLLVYLGRYTEASALIERIYSSDEFTSAQKFRTVYFLGRSRRDTETEPFLYLAAARYGNDEERVRMKALAAYSLLRQGYAEQAHDLLKGEKLPRDPDIQLLWLVLRAEVDRDTTAVREIRARRDSLKATIRKRKDANLAQRALRIPGVLD